MMLIESTDTKEVLGSELRKGDKVLSYIFTDWDGSRRKITSGHNVVSTEKGITLAWDDGKIAKEHLPYEYTYLVYITEEAFVAKYEDKAREVVEGLSTTLTGDVNFGYRSDDIEWPCLNPYELAKRCVNSGVKIIGTTSICKPIYSWKGKHYDRAVIGEKSSGERLWWYAVKEEVDETLDFWAVTHKKDKTSRGKEIYEEAT